MNDELFNIAPTKSPRLKWMERHHLTVEASTASVPNNGSRDFVAIHGMKPIGYGATPDEALLAAAKSLNIRLWNEE